MGDQVVITGLKELNRALKRLDTELPKAVRLALNEGTEVLAGRIRAQVPSDSGRARSSVKARSTRTAARLAVGGARAPYYPWLDFGGQGRKKGRPSHRAFIREGRYVYPTLRKYKPELMENLSKALTEVVHSSGMEVS